MFGALLDNLRLGRDGGRLQRADRTSLPSQLLDHDEVDMKRTLLAGAVLAIITTAIVLLSDALGLDAQGVALLGTALGGALGLVPDRSPAQRALAFGVGFVASWFGYGLRAAALPDTAGGRAVAVLVVLAICLAVAGLSRGRLPLWAAFLGAAAIAGAYEPVYAEDPTAFVTSSAATATSVLLAAGAGFLATALLGPQVEAERERERVEARLFEPASAAHEPRAQHGPNGHDGHGGHGGHDGHSPAGPPAPQPVGAAPPGAAPVGEHHDPLYPLRPRQED